MYMTSHMFAQIAYVQTCYIMIISCVLNPVKEFLIKHK